jgi:hypothetical protein
MKLLGSEQTLEDHQALAIPGGTDARLSQVAATITAVHRASAPSDTDLCSRTLELE